MHANARTAVVTFDRSFFPEYFKVSPDGLVITEHTECDDFYMAMSEVGWENQTAEWKVLANGSAFYHTLLHCALPIEKAGPIREATGIAAGLELQPNARTVRSTITNWPTSVLQSMFDTL